MSQSLNRRAPQVEKSPSNDVIGDEDCLYLNVYTTSLSGCKPVMFWVHGGGYTAGTASAENKKPDYFMTKDVVLVAPNYRLGALGPSVYFKNLILPNVLESSLSTRRVIYLLLNFQGFMNLNHPVMPGNLGLKDLIIALEWVKENIVNFSGDPCNVTIFGASAGGSLCHALVISPRTQGKLLLSILQ